jgi:hypothetical protein
MAAAEEVLVQRDCSILAGPPNPAIAFPVLEFCSAGILLVPMKEGPAVSEFES